VIRLSFEHLSWSSSLKKVFGFWFRRCSCDSFSFHLPVFGFGFLDLATINARRVPTGFDERNILYDNKLHFSDGT
jgi:hypothetical protein